MIKTLKKPLTTAQVKKLTKDGKESLTVNVVVSTDEMIDNDFEGFLDLVAERVHDSGLLEDFSYKPIGMTKKQDVIFEVVGSASAILDNDGDEEDEE